jgi:homocitrate synthase NifV
MPDSSTFEPFNPEIVGGTRRLMVGKHSGRAVVRHALEENGVEVDEALLPDCLDAARRYAIEHRSEVPTDALLAMYQQVARKPVGV